MSQNCYSNHDGIWHGKNTKMHDIFHICIAHGAVRNDCDGERRANFLPQPSHQNWMEGSIAHLCAHRNTLAQFANWIAWMPAVAGCMSFESFNSFTRWSIARCSRLFTFISTDGFVLFLMYALVLLCVCVCVCLSRDSNHKTIKHCAHSHTDFPQFAHELFLERCQRWRFEWSRCEEKQPKTKARALRALD